MHPAALVDLAGGVVVGAFPAAFALFEHALVLVAVAVDLNA